jgi:acetolactate synthase-1/2/3 large subunit
MKNMTVVEYLASFLFEKHAKEIFCISGAGNIRLLDAFHSSEGLELICPHHEQSAVMAATTFYRLSGRPGVVCVTAGPGATNTITGVANAYLDSIPVLIIAGQEKSEFMDPSDKIRGKGVQGLDMVSIVEPITKYAACVRNAKEVVYHLEKAFHLANSGRPGPVWLEIPQDIQWEKINPSELKGFEASPDLSTDYQSPAKDLLDMLKTSRRPLIWAGHGIRLAHAEQEFRSLIDALGVPILTSWQAADLVGDDHPLYFGHAGTYGQRAANFILQNCDLLIALGTRLAIPQRGYSDSEFAPHARKVIVEIDPIELKKFKMPIDIAVEGDVGQFIRALLPIASDFRDETRDWMRQCVEWKSKYPNVIPEHRVESPGFVNSYVFIDKLSEMLSPDDVIVTDMGTSLTCTHQAIRLKEGQKLKTSTGLGEMGFGLPGAIGAAFGSPGRRIILIAGEGSLMMNLQEIQTVVHHQLPIYFFVLNNDCYLTIKHTEKALFDGKLFATSPETGVSFPNLPKIAEAFGLPTVFMNSESEMEEKIKATLALKGPAFCNIRMSSEQILAPKSAVKKRADGSIYSPPLEDLYPFLPREEIEANRLQSTQHEAGNK